MAPKGRGVDPAARARVHELLDSAGLADRSGSVARDLLIECLHALQDSEGCLRHEHLAALAEVMKLSLAEVFEVATFYAHFDVVLEGGDAPPPVTIRVCESIACALAGATELREELAKRLGDGVRVVAAPCIGRCETAPAVMLGQHAIGNATLELVEAALHAGRLKASLPDYEPLQAYRHRGGYSALQACRAGMLTPAEVIEKLEQAGLRGMGGAGFRAAAKWRMVREQPGPRLLAVNADEGEPGTFKDRHYLEAHPHSMLEGMLIAAWAIDARQCYIYLRDEYPHIHKLLTDETALLEREGVVQPDHIVLRRGAGAYICGEETAMLESIEGKRGYPRHKPPYPTQVGLFGRPTLIHNVETLCWVPEIVLRGPEWMASQGRHGRSGLRSYSVSGRVRRPGVKLAPAGITARELIEEYCGGMLPGHTFKAYLPGGASGGILPARLADVPLDFGALEQHGCFIGSAAIVVFSDRDNMRDVALNLMRFFEDESCGQCTPCRCGTEKAVQLMSERKWDEPLLQDLSAAMRDASICGLGQAAPNPLLCVLRYFPEDLR